MKIKFVERTYEIERLLKIELIFLKLSGYTFNIAAHTKSINIRTTTEH
jgi:hypothetical protein